MGDIAARLFVLILLAYCVNKVASYLFTCLISLHDRRACNLEERHQDISMFVPIFQ